jgi:hypothetical protein
MIEDLGLYYLYRHVRLDKNEPFYIGIGKKCKKGVKYQYKRALDFVLRSELWKRIYNKSNKTIKVDILLESDNHEFIKQKEIEFIKLYGRINRNSGILCNFTDGGDTRAEIKITPESKLKRSELAKKRRPSIKFFENSRKTHIIKVYQYDLEGNFIREFESLTEAAKSCNSVTTNISKCCKGNFHTAGGFIWRYNKTDKIEPAKVTWKAKIYKYSLKKELITIYNNSEEASYFEDLHYCTIQKYSRQNYKPKNKLFFFSYFSPESINNIKISETKEKSPLKSQKCIIVLKDDKFYKKYNSIGECSRDLKIRRNKLSESLNKNKTIYKNIKIINYES